MAQIKAGDVDSWLAGPDPKIAGLLIYGPDRGLVSERARGFAKSCGVALDDPFSLVRIEAAELDSDPGRLADELQTVSMFSPRRLVWVRNAAAQKSLPEALKLLEPGESQAILLIEAGDLKKTSPLRQTAEAARHSAALPCYADDARAMDRLIDQELTAAQKTMTLDARTALKQRLGGDRLASRGEIAKLMLYAGTAQRIEIADVTAAIGDVSAVTIDGAADAVLSGDRKGLDAAVARAFQSGVHPFVLLSAMLRQIHQLQIMRAEIDRAGKSEAAAVASARPPVFFARRSLLENALKSWSAQALERAAGHLQDTILQSRRMPGLGEELCRQALFALSGGSRRRT